MIRILIAEEHAVIREGLKQIVAANRDMVMAGEAKNGQELVDEISKDHYDAAILDISITDRNWLDVLKELRGQRPNLPVLLLSAHADGDNAVRAFRAGASGYVTIESAQDELLAALRKALSGGKYVSASLGEKLASDLERGTEKPPHELLSDREYQVMGLLAGGRTVSEIASEMSLSVKTISTYRSRILEKLNLKNNVEVARYYTRFVDTRTVTCKECGKDNPQMARFCAHCGADLDAITQLFLTASAPASETAETDVQPELIEIFKKPVSFFAKSRRVLAASAVVLVAVAVIWRTQLSSESHSPPVATQAAVELRHDDGIAEATLSSDFGGYLIRFSPPSVPFVVRRIRVYGVTLPSKRTHFEVQIWDEGRNVLYSASYPLAAFPAVVSEPPRQNARWIELTAPDIELKTDFFVHLFANSTLREGVQIGIDDSTKNLHSGLTRRLPEGNYRIREGWGNYEPDTWFSDKGKVNWMIRVVGRNRE